MNPQMRRGLLRLWVVATPPWALYWWFAYQQAAPQDKVAIMVFGFGGPTLLPALVWACDWVVRGFARD